MPNISLATLKKSNNERIEHLAAQGAQLHPFTILDAKLDGIIDHLSCEKKVEERIAKRLDVAEDDFARAKITAGLHLPNFGKDNGQ